MTQAYGQSEASAGTEVVSGPAYWWFRAVAVFAGSATVGSGVFAFYCLYLVFFNAAPTATLITLSAVAFLSGMSWHNAARAFWNRRPNGWIWLCAPLALCVIVAFGYVVVATAPA